MRNRSGNYRRTGGSLRAGARASLGRNIAAMALLQALNYLVPLATVPYLVRVLGPSGFGSLSFAQAVVLYFDLLTNYGFNLSATRAVARQAQNPTALARIFWETVTAKSILMLLSAGGLGLIVATTPRMRVDAGVYAGWFLTVVGTVTLPVFFFQGIERMAPVTAAHGAARILSVPMLFILVRHAGDYGRAAVIQGSVPVVASVFLVPTVRKLVGPRPQWPARTELRRAFRDGRRLFLADAGLTLSITAVPIVLGFVAGNIEVGFYSAADKIVRAASAALNPIAQALYPRLNHLKTHSLPGAIGLMRASFVWICGAALIVSLSAFLFAHSVGPALWGEAFGRSVVVLRLMAPLPVLLALINILGIQTMLVFEMDASLSHIVLWGAVMSAALTAALGAKFGATGAAAATLMAMFAVVARLAWVLRRRLPFRWSETVEECKT